MDRRKKMIYGGAGLAVMLLVVIVVVVAWPRIKAASNVDCTPTKIKPDLKSMVVNNVATDDKTALANLAGFLELKKDGGYVPVEVESIVITKKENSSMFVELKAKCVSFDFYYSKITKGASNYKYWDIRMLVKDDTKPGPDKFTEICKFEKPFSFDQPIDRRFSCQQQQIHSCSTKKDSTSTVVANLVLRSIEFEFDADPEKAGEGLFSKAEWDTSCQAW